MKPIKLIAIVFLFVCGAAALLISFRASLGIDARRHPTATGEWMLDILQSTPTEIGEYKLPTLPALATLPPFPTFPATWTPATAPTLPDIRPQTPTPIETPTP